MSMVAFSRYRVRVAVGVVAGLLPVLAGALPAAAATGSTTATIPIAVISITVSPGNVTFANCIEGNSLPGALGFPNGHCSTPTITITNTGAASHVFIQGTDATPLDGGTKWALCNPIPSDNLGGPACTGAPTGFAAFKPGADQFDMQNLANQGVGPLILTTPLCDNALPFTPCGAALANTAYMESVAMQGPTSSTDQSNSFSTTITWTATQ
jgi:hypothetical protein